MNTQQDASIAWAIGLFEGEGHFGVKPRRPGYRVLLIMGLTTTDQDVIERFAKIAGCGTIQPKRIVKNKPHWKPQYTWLCSGKAALALAETFRPMLGRRRLERLNEILVDVADSQPKPKKCEWCATEFIPNRFARQRFCTTRCIDRAKYMRRKYGISSKAEADIREILGTIRPERKTQCPRGHKYEGDNLTIYTRPNGGKERRCKACARERYHEYKRRN